MGECIEALEREIELMRRALAKQESEKKASGRPYREQ